MKQCINISLYLTFGVFFLHSCFNAAKDLSEKLSEGEVTYKISYNQDVESHSMSFVYPKEMTLYFKDNKQRLSFKGGLGLYAFDFIFGGEHDTVYTLLKINLFEKKYFVPTINKNLLIFPEISEEIITTLIDETKEIAGLTVKKATVKFADDDNFNVSIWYSDNFRISSPNKNTPFHEVPGVPLESEVVFKNVTFSYKAHKINPKTINDDVFTVPDDFVQITLEEMEDLLGTVF